jgi:hypothetical protein
MGASVRSRSALGIAIDCAHRPEVPPGVASMANSSLVRPDIRAFTTVHFVPFHCSLRVCDNFCDYRILAYRPDVGAERATTLGRNNGELPFAFVGVGRRPARTVPMLRERSGFRVTRRPDII